MGEGAGQTRACGRVSQHIVVNIFTPTVQGREREEREERFGEEERRKGRRKRDKEGRGDR